MAGNSAHYEENTKIGKIEKVEGKAGQLSSQEPVERMPPNREQFENLVNDPNKQKDQGLSLEANTREDLVDKVSQLNRQVERAKQGSPEQLVAQAAETVEQIDKLKRQLNRPDLRLKGSLQNLLRNRLEHIDDTLKVALNRAGVEYSPPAKVTGVVNPVERFFSMLTSSQHNLETLTDRLQTMAANKQTFNPADTLLIQVKVATIQQEVEFFSNVLNKALESTKTIMNVQV